MPLYGSPYSRLSHKQREQTPEPLARYLVTRSGATVALWVRRDTVYRSLGMDCWDKLRDARLYSGNERVIAHPPCGPWGKLAWNCKYQFKEDGITAMRIVHRVGGVVEQPVGSSLFREYGCECGLVEQVDQADFGHPIKKPTLLFWHP